MLQRPNKIEKLKVLAFKKPTRKGASADFSFLINPETIKSSHQNKFSKAQGTNTSGRTASYAFSKSDQMVLQLTLDNTLLVDNFLGAGTSSKVDLKEYVDKFLKACFYMDGDIHEPRFLLLEWGKIAFECRLKSIEVNYSHFNEKGAPLRVTLDTVFVADMPDSKRIRLENKKSPDITHTRTILASQTLTGLCTEIYGNASHYLFVAKANKINHFRQLKPGDQLHFPPLLPNQK